MTENRKVLAVVGGGAMGSALVGGIVRAGVWKADDIVVTDINPAVLESLSDTYKVNSTTNCEDAVSNADIILLAVKPADVEKHLSAVGTSIRCTSLLISIAAGITIETIEKMACSHAAVIRAMPNTPCQIGCGATAFARGSYANDTHAGLAQMIFGSVGIALEVPEPLLDAVTGLSGSGPAFIYVLIEALSDAGVAEGLPRDKALALAAQTVMGAAQMVLQTKSHPAQLKDRVSSPSGTTIAGLATLEKSGFRSAVIEAVKAAANRSRELR